METLNLNTIQAVNLALHDAMKADDTLLVIGEDVGDREEGGVVGATRGLSTAYGTERVRSTPISEQAIIGSAIGAAICGHKVVAEIMLMNFTTVAMDMIVNHAAKLRFMSGGQTHVPIVIRMMTGAGFSNGGQHSDYLEAWFAHTAGIKVVAPSSPNEAYGLLRAAIEDPDPVIFIENLPTYFTPAAVTPEVIPLGKAKVVREGGDVTLVSYAAMMGPVNAAAEELAAGGVSCEVIDLRTIAPWDRETVVASAAKTGRLLVVHEAVRAFGVGAEIAAEVNEELFGKLKAPVRRLGGAYCPVPYSKPLENAFPPSHEQIVATVRAMV
ncbi:alpha-ketoacid dehydrogenase subunit beta [Novosphingobium sp. fls2-241-R2A-195]|jgi:pyruvate dehydrogenase E1 component beta subunit|uniref:alpha-ketoacid dehydrogenase subunit beta n=1 Tax=Novosphingobium sp. fls2-241-R2A-195 TaxID=3040296 RepID=UPI002550EE45|nr:alpha-ketoacid dehydrogenase subunit beta [Novosphingobium sp. fls2-241-R2A-195]